MTDCYDPTRGVKSGNKEFSSAVASWTFQESLALRIDSVTHHRVNHTESQEAYTTNDEIVCPLFMTSSLNRL